MGLEQRQQILQGIRLHVRIAQQRLGTAMPHPALHEEQWVSHRQPLAGKSVPERVQRQAGINRRQQAAHPFLRTSTSKRREQSARPGSFDHAG
jgi:hypothetical protein